MPKPRVIKKYPNRRLYDTEISSYITLEDVRQLIVDGEEVEVRDAKSGEDLSRSVLLQIISEHEEKGNPMFSTQLLSQVIRFYGDSLQGIVPGYLDMSMSSFTKEQERFREQMAQAFGKPFEAYEEQVRQNMALFERAFRMFSPFAAAEFAGSMTGAPKQPSAPAKPGEGDLEALRRQMADMQKKLDEITRKG